jgi:hypothetical protein
MFTDFENAFGVCSPYLAIKIDVLLLVEEAPLLVEGRLRWDGDVHGRAHCLWDLQKIHFIIKTTKYFTFFNFAEHRTGFLFVTPHWSYKEPKLLSFYAHRCGAGLRTETVQYRAINRRANTFVLPQTS